MRLQAVIHAMVIVSLGSPVLMASPQDDPTDCAMLIAKKISSDPNSIKILIEMAQCLGAGRAQQSMQLIDYVLQMPRIQENRASLDFFDLQAISSLYCTLGRRDKALVFLSAVLADAERLPDARKRLVRPYVVRAYADIGEYDRSVHLIDMYTRERPDDEDDERLTKARELTYVAFCACRNGKTGYAMEMLSRAYAHSTATRITGWKAGSLNYIVYGFLECGNVDRALAIAQEMSDALDLIDVSEERLCPVRFKVVALIGAAQKLGDIGRVAEAVGVLDKASCIAEKIEHRYLKAEMMKDVATAYAGAGEYVVRSWLDLEMQPPQDDAKPIENAGALRVAGAIEHPVIKGMTLNRIAGQCIKAGDNEKGIEIASAALQVVKNVADDSRDAYEGELGFYEISKPRVLAEITETFVRACASNAHPQTSERCALQHIDEAMNWLAASGKLHLTYSKIPLLYAAAGEQQKAIQIAMQLMKGIHLWTGADILETLALRAAERGKYDEARTAVTALEEGLMAPETVAALEKGFRTPEAAKEIGVARYRRVAMAHVSRVRRQVSAKLAEKGQYAQSLEMAAQITTPAEKSLALIQIGTHYPADGDKVDVKAKDILRDIAKEAQSMKTD